MQKSQLIIGEKQAYRENEIITLETVQILEENKVTIQKSGKNKTSTSFLAGIPDKAIHLLIDIFEFKEGYTVLEKKDKYLYELLITNELKPGMIKLKDAFGFDGKNRTYQTTLPKRHIEFLQAYDKYLETIEYINKKYDKDFKPSKITMSTTINFAPKDEQELQKEVLIYFNVDIDDEFKGALSLLYKNNPDWLELLTNNPYYAPSTF